MHLYPLSLILFLPHPRLSDTGERGGGVSADLWWCCVGVSKCFFCPENLTTKPTFWGVQVAICLCLTRTRGEKKIVMGGHLFFVSFIWWASVFCFEAEFVLLEEHSLFGVEGFIFFGGSFSFFEVVHFFWQGATECPLGSTGPGCENSHSHSHHAQTNTHTHSLIHANTLTQHTHSHIQ